MGVLTDDRPLLVQYKGKFYDISKFADKHPGGRKVLQKVAGNDIEKFMKGEERIMGVKHAHSDAAFQILERYSLDPSCRKNDLVDSGKALLFKVGHLKEKYWRWIHEPYEGKLRLFENDFIESLTSTQWWTIPLVWLPIVIWSAFNGLNLFYQQRGIPEALIIASIILTLGTLSWTLVEYTLHRYVFHWKPDLTSYTQITLHFVLHGLHHKAPMDPGRLVVPPVPGAFCVAGFYLVYRSIFPLPVFWCFFSGQLFGYMCYELTHYYLHHGQPRPATDFHFRKVYHHNHHFKDFDDGYGITTTFWDYIFNTKGTGPL